MRVAHNKGTSKVDAKAARAAYEACGNASEVGRCFGVSVSCAIRAIKMAGGFVKPKTLVTSLKEEALRLYVEHEISANEAAARLGMHASTANRFIRKHGLSRSSQEAHALDALKKTNRKGKTGWWHSTKTGAWEVADSRYELVRMSQLDADETIEHWTRQTPIIRYATHKRYVPDFLIQYTDGRRVLEEVKPQGRVEVELAQSGKLQAATEYAAANGLEFRVVTEHEIGVNTIRTFVMDGLLKPEETLRLQRKKAVDQAYRDKNRARENSRTLNWYHRNHDREVAKRAAKRTTGKILQAWSVAL